MKEDKEGDKDYIGNGHLDYIAHVTIGLGHNENNDDDGHRLTRRDGASSFF